MKLSELRPDAEGYLCRPDTGERVVFYECDPHKNFLCDRQLCRALAGTESEAEFGFCSCTPEPAFCKDGGRAFYKRLNEDGYYGREYIDEGGGG